MKFKIQDPRFKIFNTIIRLLSSKEFLLWLTGSWIIYYVVLAIWSKEAFSRFITGLTGNPLIQIPYLIFLLSLSLNFIRRGLDVCRSSRLGFILWGLLPLGAVVFFISFFVSLNTRKDNKLIVGEGQIISTTWGKEQYLVTNILPSLKEEMFDDEAGEGIFAHEPRMMVVNERQELFEIGAYPPREINYTYYHILKVGLAPGVRFSEGDNVVSEGYMPQLLLPPGATDSFEIKPYPYKFYIKIIAENIPERKIKRYNLKDPVYEVRISKGDRLVWKGDSRSDILFDNNMKLSFFQPVYWVWLEAVRDKAFLYIVSGILLIVIGAPARLIFFVIMKRRLRAEGDVAV